MIEIKNLTKKISGNLILDNINFSVNKGEVLGFLGPNGAGKTTTMKIITGFWTASQGDVLVDNISVRENSLATRKKIGYLPENVPLYEDMLVYEYLKFIANVRGLEKDAIKPRIKEVMEICGLKDVIRRPIEELSKGFRQRVGLAQAILHNPEVLILDEPTTGLDPNQIVEIRELIKRIGEEKTVIFSTHILSEISATCDRVIIINKGKVAKEGRPEELIQNGVSETSIYLKIRGFKEDVLRKVANIEKVKDVKIISQDDERICSYVIEPATDQDLREYLAAFVINSGWGLLEIKKKDGNMEDVFRELTK